MMVMPYNYEALIPLLQAVREECVVRLCDGIYIICILYTSCMSERIDGCKREIDTIGFRLFVFCKKAAFD